MLRTELTESQYEELDEGLQQHYKEKDGKYVIHLDADPGNNRTIRTLRAETKKLKNFLFQLVPSAKGEDGELSDGVAEAVAEVHDTLSILPENFEPSMLRSDGENDERDDAEALAELDTLRRENKRLQRNVLTQTGRAERAEERAKALEDDFNAEKTSSELSSLLTKHGVPDDRRRKTILNEARREGIEVVEGEVMVGDLALSAWVDDTIEACPWYVEDAAPQDPPARDPKGRLRVKDRRSQDTNREFDSRKLADINSIQADELISRALAGSPSE